jgi:ribosomal protein S18 acetylase RimI-like enzyme
VSADVYIAAALTDAEIDAVRGLFREYARTPHVDVCVVGFDDEIRALPGAYAEPRGTVLLAQVTGVPAGCVAIKPVDDSTAEMKRLFVRQEARGLRIGERLALAAIAAARARGYQRLRLDTLPSMTEARAIYSRLGFKEVVPFGSLPVAGATWMELAL